MGEMSIQNGGFTDVSAGVSNAHESIQDSIESKLNDYYDRYGDGAGAGSGGDKDDSIFR